MTTIGSGDSSTLDSAVGPEMLALRARPQPVTRINRKVLIGGAAVLLLMISGIVLVALKPPTLRAASPLELVDTVHKPITDGLSRLPASYEGVRADTKIANGQIQDPLTPPSRETSPGVPDLKNPAGDPVTEAELVERARLARMAGQARESQLFFRLALKAPPPEAPAADVRPATVPGPGAMARDDELAASAALRRTEGARSAVTSDIDGSDNNSVSDQTHKLSFLKSTPEKDVYNPHGLQRPASPYQLMAGTIIAASLVTGLNSDLPGFVIAQVTENVYDTVSGHYLLVPQGSRLVGRYDNVVAFGQERALVVWQRIILPDGSSIVIDNLPATDTGGYAGLEDQVDIHTWKLLKGVALATVLGVGSQLAVGTSSGTDSDLVKALQQSVQSTTNRAGQRLVERNLNVQPTITVRPGWPLRVIVHKDIVLHPYRATSSP
jgi:type IV secretion system protein VirB10